MDRKDVKTSTCIKQKYASTVDRCKLSQYTYKGNFCTLLDSITTKSYIRLNTNSFINDIEASMRVKDSVNVGVISWNYIKFVNYMISCLISSDLKKNLLLEI